MYISIARRCGSSVLASADVGKGQGTNLSRHTEFNADDVFRRSACLLQALQETDRLQSWRVHPLRCLQSGGEEREQLVALSADHFFGACNLLGSDR